MDAHDDPLTTPITRENCGRFLQAIRERTGTMTREELASLLGVGRATIVRVEEAPENRPVASDDFMNRLHAVQLIGVAKLAEMPNNQREAILNALGKVYAAGFGAKGIPKVLTAAGILTGLGTIGGAIGLARAAVLLPSLPSIAIAGFGLIKGLKAIIQANDLKVTEIDGRWELTKAEDKENDRP